MPLIMVNGKKVYCRFSKKIAGNRETLLLLHGSGGEGSVWGYQLAGLAHRFNLIIPDLPGHGKSEGDGLFSVEACAGWVSDLATVMELSDFFVAGHSLGGAVAQAFASACPEKIRGLVLVGTGLNFDVSQEYLHVLQVDFEKAVKISCDRAYAAAAGEQYRKGFDMLLKNGRKTLYTDMLACRAFDGTAGAGAIDAPCLVVCGQKDRITAPELSIELSAKIKNSRLCLVPEAGHMVMIEAKDRVNREIENFVIKQRV